NLVRCDDRRRDCAATWSTLFRRSIPEPPLTAGNLAPALPMQSIARFVPPPPDGARRSAPERARRGWRGRASAPKNCETARTENLAAHPNPALRVVPDAVDVR